MIAFGHMSPLFGMSLEPFNFGQAVSFFFVLSGFILTWVYPSLKDGAEVRRFLVARFARVWPAHIATLVLTFILLSSSQRFFSMSASWWMLPANILMVHAWIPYKACGYHYNTPSWSVSTEVFFYLCFPLLIAGLRQTWRLKLLFAAVLTLGMITLCNVLHVPDGLEPLEHGISAHVMVYHQPLTRLFEFVLGMSMALLFQSLRTRVKIRTPGGTVIEMATVCLVVVVMFYSGRMASWTQGTFPAVGEPGVLWMFAGGICAPFFGLLIVVMALNLGRISWLLSLPALVLLGEISYSIYLVHFMILRYYEFHSKSVEWIPAWVRFCMLWTIFLFASHMMWKYVEKPCREMIRAWGGRDGPPRWEMINPISNWRAFVIEAAVLAALVLPVVLSVHPVFRR